MPASNPHWVSPSLAKAGTSVRPQGFGAAHKSVQAADPSPPSGPRPRTLGLHMWRSVFPSKTDKERRRTATDRGAALLGSPSRGLGSSFTATVDLTAEWRLTESRMWCFVGKMLVAAILATGLVSVRHDRGAPSRVSPCPRHGCHLA